MAEVKDYSAEALLAKEKEVELDTDDVKEENVEVKEVEKKEKEPNLNVGEVDLGYTGHEKPSDEKKEQPKIEIAEEVKEEAVEEKKVEPKSEKEKPNLQDSRRDYQKRIDKLVFQKKEAERREKAALDFAQGLQKKFDTNLRKLNTTDEQYLKELDARVDAQREQVKVALQQAIEKQDASKMMEANDKLTQLAVEKEKAKMRKEQLEQQKTEAEELAKQQPQQQEPIPQQEPSEKAKAWADENTWFGQDKVMTNAAYTIHTDLVQKGFDPESDDYYTEVNKQMRENFPNRFAEERPVQTVASAGRKQQGRRTVKLTRSQVAIARKLGVPLEEYAKHVKG